MPKDATDSDKITQEERVFKSLLNEEGSCTSALNAVRPLDAAKSVGVTFKVMTPEERTKVADILVGTPTVGTSTPTSQGAWDVMLANAKAPDTANDTWINTVSYYSAILCKNWSEALTKEERRFVLRMGSCDWYQLPLDERYRMVDAMRERTIPMEHIQTVRSLACASVEPVTAVLDLTNTGWNCLQRDYGPLSKGDRTSHLAPSAANNKPTNASGNNTLAIVGIVFGVLALVTVLMFGVYFKWPHLFQKQPKTRVVPIFSNI